MYRRIVTIIFLMAPLLTIESAAPITHVYTAEMWIDENTVVEESVKEAFIVGSLFPDIRYLGTISRKETHRKGVSSKQIRQSTSSFRAGMLHHSLVDEKRENFIKKNKTLHFFVKIPRKLRVFFLKLLEDEILWEKTDITLAQHALHKISEEELAVGVDEQTVKLWHAMMIDYLAQRPSEFLALRASQGEGFLNKIGPKTAEEWSRLLPQYAKSPFVLLYMQRLNDYLLKVFNRD